jgi:hypothetical protein
VSFWSHVSKSILAFFWWKTKSVFTNADVLQNIQRHEK